MNRKILNNQQGLTMIEMVLVIAIIAILALLATSGKKTVETAKIETTVDHFENIYSAAIQWQVRESKHDFTDITDTAVQGYLTALTLAGGGLWGGDYSVAPGSSPSMLSVSVTNIDSNAVSYVVDKLLKSGWDASSNGTTVTATKSA